MDAKRLVLSLSIAVGLLGSSSASALQEASPGASPMGGPPLPEGCTVIAEGLVNPRYVAVGDDGAIYVSEAGTGGEETIEMPAAGGDATPVDLDATPVAEEGMGHAISTRGGTGQVTMIAPDGTQSVIATGLPSYSIGGPEITGPAGITVDANGQILLAVGGAGPLTLMVEALPNENSVVSIDPATGEVTLLANIDAYERANNPDPNIVDSNLFGIDVAEDGTIYVNDAGGNTTYSVPAGGGEPVLVAVHPGIEIPADQAPPGGNPGRGGANELDPVPTDVLTTADGTVLVSYLSGGPFPPGASKVVSVAADGTLADVVTGLTMTVGLAAGPDGQLYVSQISTNFLGEMPEPGNVVRVLEDGTQEVVVGGLMLPNGIAFEEDGSLLIVTGATSPGEPMGQLLRCEGIA
ncbi:MAG TPA: ScyD/ScyE family protein, partial [Thermomicrobiales bacterium]|nr:ScyD/ScyE family protein [Thermomicrobiales bacterium]